MSEELGIEETKEALEGVLDVAVVIASLLKDGAQLGDLVELWNQVKDNEELKASLEKAYDGIKKVPAEVKDVDLGEGLDLAGVLLKKVPVLLSAMKKEADA